MKKRILAGLTAVVLCIPLFAGCSQKAETEAPAAGNNAAEEEAEETGSRTGTDPRNVKRGGPFHLLRAYVCGDRRRIF